ncbi:hypothetical protein Baya_5127 [Bagarius yarrelli]|uniref:Uncharacterized protein n=1 Tax=Bagarius yarrelli TaxID=175774 RepID=A0A556TTL6_BAGYA|nr:hypothetical protein Baya_5127 [Bagarius yarrelli]
MAYREELKNLEIQYLEKQPSLEVNRTSVSPQTVISGPSHDQTLKRWTVSLTLLRLVEVVVVVGSTAYLCYERQVFQGFMGLDHKPNPLDHPCSTTLPRVWSRPIKPWNT